MSISPPRDEATLAVRQSVYVDASRAASWGLSVNLFLMVVKLLGGFMTASSALIADAVNSIGDVASSLMVRVALAVAQIDEDDDHPYGHTKAESIAGLCVALLVVFGASLLALETIRELGSTLVVPPLAAGLIAGVCGLIKEIVYQYTCRVAKRLNSSALQATAWDHRADAISSGLVCVSLLSAPYLGTAGKYVDSVVALLVCGLLVATGVRLFRSIARELMDQQADEETVAQVRRASAKVEGVAEIEKLRVRKSGLEYFIEIHVQVDGMLTVNEGHRIGHDVKDRLLLEMPRVRDVHVHVEPWGESQAHGPESP